MLTLNDIPTGDADCLAARRSDHSPLEMTLVQTCVVCLKETNALYFDGVDICRECISEQKPDFSWIDEVIASVK